MSFRGGLLLTVFLVISNFSNAQLEDSNWFFGTNAYLDFSSGTPIAGIGSLVTIEGCASISDTAGNLHFYTDGVNAWDKFGTPEVG